MDPASLMEGRSRETTIRRDTHGRWFQDDVELEHAGITRAFDRWIERAEDGRYCLKNDVNWAYVSIEGPPFFVRYVRIDEQGIAQLTLSDDRIEPLDPRTLRQTSDGALYCDVHAGSMVARFDRRAMQQLEDTLREDAQGVYLQLRDQRVRPPLVSDPLLLVGSASKAQTP